jgi:4-amino-4-deoxy-L-arabinose transferase-like glycosyltransferase
MLRVTHLRAQTGTANLVNAPSTAISTSFLMAARRRVSPVVLVLLASAVVTVCFLSVLPERFRLNEETDFFTSYEPVARNFVAGRGFLRADGSFSTSHPPGYPLLLAGIFSVSKLLGVSEELSLSAFAIICMALVSVFVFLLARMLWGVAPGLIASLIWMTYPFALWLTKQPNSELPFMVALYGGLCLFWYAMTRRLPARAYFLCGLILGAAMLIRPTALGVGLVLSVLVWFTRRELSRRTRALMMSMLVLGSLVMVLPWEAWSYHKTGQVIPLSSNGVNSMRDGVTFAVWTKGYRQESNVSPDVLQVMENIRAQQDEISTFGDLRSIMVREFQAHPVAVTKLLLLKLGRSWYGTDSRRLEKPILLIQLGYLLVVAWGAWNAWKRRGRYRAFLIGTLLMTAYFWGMTFLALSILRYMMPVIGLLFVLVAACYPLKRRNEPRNESPAIA